MIPELLGILGIHAYGSIFHLKIPYKEISTKFGESHFF